MQGLDEEDKRGNHNGHDDTKPAQEEKDGELVECWQRSKLHLRGRQRHTNTDGTGEPKITGRTRHHGATEPYMEDSVENGSRC